MNVADLVDPKWADKWWKSKPGDFTKFRIERGNGTDSPEELDIPSVPFYWSSQSGVQLMPEGPERRDQFEKELNATWREKYSRDRGGEKVPTGARVLNVLRVENHDAY